MMNVKVLSIFNNLEGRYSEICSEIESFMNGIIQWGDELPDVLENELSTKEDASLFAVPKTPCEMKTRKKTRKNSGRTKTSKYSVLDSTANQNDFSTMNDSISTRTRSARRAAANVSQLNVSKMKLELPLNYSEMATILVEDKTASDASEATFVVPKATTRTKPVLRNKQQEETIRVSEPETTVEGKGNVTAEKSQAAEAASGSVGNVGENSVEVVEVVEVARKLSRTLSPSSRREKSNKVSLIVNESSVSERASRRKASKSSTGFQADGIVDESPTSRFSGVGRSPSQSPVRRSSRINTSGNIFQNCDPTTPEFNSLANRTVTIKKESTPIGAGVVAAAVEGVGRESNGEKTSTTRCSRSSITVAEKAEKTPTGTRQADEWREYNGSTVTQGTGEVSTGSSDKMAAEEACEDVPVPKKKRKLKKKEEAKENIEDTGTVRITRTKSKAIKKMLEEAEAKQADLSVFAKKLLNRAKMTSMRKSKLAAVIECNAAMTPVNRPGQPNLPFGNLTSSKYHLLLSSSKKFKTPLATLPNSAVKSTKSGQMKRKISKRDSSAENAVRSVTKPQKDDQYEKEIKLKSQKEKEEEAALKRQNVIKSKQEELKKKNEMKRQMAMKQREKLEQEKYQNMVQLEKEKEERHKLILQERQMKLKEEAFKKKMITMQKIAETTERRRLEEEARIARLKEMEAEEQRIALEKQKEQERQEKRAQERLAQKKAREEYEMQLKQELEAERMRAEREKTSTAKKCLTSASKRQKFAILGEKKDWDYKPRNENDYGLEHENSDSEGESNYSDSNSPIPWASRILNMKSPKVKVLTLEMLCEFIPCYQKSPDVYRMFKMTPSKRIKRSSSAIWNTPSS